MESGSVGAHSVGDLDLKVKINSILEQNSVSKG